MNQTSAIVERTTGPQTAASLEATASVTRALRWGAWSLLALLLVANVPLFLCQHLTSDAVIYDLQARCALDGGVLYRDIVEPNLPGAVWIHMTVRCLFGWSSLALRTADLVILTAVLTLLVPLISPKKECRFSLRVAGLAMAIFSLYFTLTEWCHCQRDLWMLLPSLAAVHLRRRGSQLDVSSGTDRTNTSIKRGMLSLVEGAFWGIAFWIKPHIAIPAACVLVVSLFRSASWRSKLADVALVICGGAVVGAIGSAWLIQTGAWLPFWEMQLEWNPEYLRAGRAKFSLARLQSLWNGFAPWSWLHVPAVVLAVAQIKALFTKLRGSTDSVSREGDASAESTVTARTLLAALYLGWMAQILLLQHPFAYVHLPGVVLATALVFSYRPPQSAKLVVGMSAACFGFLVWTSSTAVNPGRLALWRECLASGPTAAVRSRIQIESQPDWRHLQPVIEFLPTQNLQDGELTAYSGGLIHLYPELGLAPSTRYVYLDVLARLFPSRAAEIHSALDNSKQRFVVSNLREAGLSEKRIAAPADPDTLLPPDLPESRLAEFPLTQPVVFRSGPYLVHRVEKPLGPLCTEYSPLAEDE